MLSRRKPYNATLGERPKAAASNAGNWATSLPQKNTALVRGVFTIVAALADLLAIVAVAVLAGTVYHHIYYSEVDITETFVQIGVVIAVLFVVPNLMRNEYAITRYLTFKHHLRRSALMWNIAFLSALVLGFITKTTSDFSRGTVLIFFLAGFAALILERALVVHFVQRGARNGGVSARRVFLVGYEDDVNAFSARYEPWTVGMRIVSASILRGHGSLAEDLALAAASARILRPDDVFILLPWSQKETIDACVNAFLRVPASIHLGPERVLDRYADARLEKIGAITSLSLARRPLATSEIVIKRIFDLVFATLGLIALSPFFLVIAILIKSDGHGPVIFRQRRYGFNQEPFRIFKFRSMSTMEDNVHLTAVKEGDARVTKVGAWMRRFNIDELPQLLNVLRGEMSLVGPRPHALVHDQLFDRTIALYARRHNVKPGITGWAQVSGYRGEIKSEERMRGRIEHDLYYIDNWSLWLDLQIIWLTLTSKKAYRGAY